MKHCFTLFLCLLAGALPLAAQQDAAFTTYRFNTLVFNPATAGSSEHLAANLLFRRQWLGIDGAPVSETLTAHTPLRDTANAVGFSLLNDKIGAGGQFAFNVAYAYRIPLGERFKLSGGLQAGMLNWHNNWHELILEEGTDAAFNGGELNRWLPNFGAGLLLYSERFYAGFSCPRLLEYDLRKAKDETGEEALYARNYRHFYFATGGAIPIGSTDLIFRPSLLLRSTRLFGTFRVKDKFEQVGSPTGLDLDAAFFFRRTLWFGVGYRTALEAGRSSNDALNVWTAWNMRNGVRLGAAYDFTISELQQVSSGSLEVMAGYEFDVKIKKVVPPRNF